MTSPYRDELKSIVDKYSVPPANQVGKLPRYTGSRDTPKNQREKKSCNECGKYHEFPSIHLDYVGHADITLMLIDVDPFWSWRPAAFDADGTPLIGEENRRLVMWGYLTVLGKEVLGVGTVDNDKGDPEKELIGDLLRNCALRFGFATSLWSKADAADPASTDTEGGRSSRRGRTHTDADAPADPVAQTAVQLAKVRFTKLTPAQKKEVTSQAKEQGIGNVMNPGVKQADTLNALIDAVLGVPGENGETVDPEAPAGGIEG